MIRLILNQKYNSNSLCLFKLGVAHCAYMLEKYNDAIKHYTEIIEIDSKSDDILYNLGFQFIIICV